MGCAGSLAFYTLDGLQKAPFMQHTPAPTIRITQIRKPYAAANGTEICLVLRPPCATLTRLCPYGTCQYAVMNDRSERTKCCPSSTFDARATLR